MSLHAVTGAGVEAEADTSNSGALLVKVGEGV